MSKTLFQYTNMNRQHNLNNHFYKLQLQDANSKYEKQAHAIQNETNAY